MKNHNVILRLIKIWNVILLTIPFGVCWELYYAGRTWAPYYAKGNWLIIALFFLLYATYGHIYDAFLVSINRISEMVYSQTLAALVSDGIMYVICWLLTKHLPAVLPLILVFIVQILLAVLWAVVSNKWYFHTYPPKRTAVVYDLREGMDQLIQDYELTVKFDVCKNIHVKDCLDGRLEELSGLEAVFLCGIHSHDRNIILKYCIAHGIAVYVIPRIGDVIMGSAHHIHMMHLPMFRVNWDNPPLEYLVAKRIFDIAVSLLCLLVFSPVFAVVSIAIKATDQGDIFYRQTRLTKGGREFEVLKFRSMRADAEEDGVARLSTGSSDDRITPVGKIIRKYRIDELPQFINILKGEMSVVGPRPERPQIAEEYESQLPEFSLRLQAKAGLTGYAQVYGKYNTTPYDKLQMDLIYIAKPGFIEDLRIIFATIKILFLPESTEGIAAGQKTAQDRRENTK